MKKYVTYTVEIPVEEGSELAKQLKEIAERNGASTKNVADAAVQLGVYEHMRRNLAIMKCTPPQMTANDGQIRAVRDGGPYRNMGRWRMGMRVR